MHSLHMKKALLLLGRIAIMAGIFGVISYLMDLVFDTPHTLRHNVIGAVVFGVIYTLLTLYLEKKKSKDDK